MCVPVRVLGEAPSGVMKACGNFGTPAAGIDTWLSQLLLGRGSRGMTLTSLSTFLLGMWKQVGCK